MLSTKLLLNNKVKTYSKQKKRAFLIDCISKHRDFSELIKKEHKHEEPEENNVCKICNKFEFIRDKFSETCSGYGYTRPITSQLKTFEKFEYIKPGSNLVKIEKEGKTITVDLNKINSWLQETDPYAKDTATIILALDTIFTSKGTILPNYVQNTSISLWYNYNTLISNLTPVNRSKYQAIKNRDILSLCIYYGAAIHGYIASIEQISLIMKTNVSSIYAANDKFKELFKETEYYKNFNLTNKEKCNIELTAKHKLILNKIIIHLKDEFKINKDTISNKDYASIIYFITNKINTNKLFKLSLKDIEIKCRVSTSTISTTSKNIENFYKKNPKLYKELLI